MGEPKTPLYRYGARIQVLGCECGEPGCWPLVCRISATDRIVRWSDFEQPHRNGSGAPVAWTYDGLGPFEFDRAEYDAALTQSESVRQGGIQP